MNEGYEGVIEMGRVATGGLEPDHQSVYLID